MEQTKLLHKDRIRHPRQHLADYTLLFVSCRPFTQIAMNYPQILHKLFRFTLNMKLFLYLCPRETDR